jgi:gluconate kinase
MNGALLASQFEVLEEPSEDLVVDIDHSPAWIVVHIRSDPRSVKVE